MGSEQFNSTIFLICFALFGMGWIAYGRNARDRGMAIAGVFILGLDVWIALRQGPRVEEWAVPILEIGLVPLCLFVGAFLLVDAIGLPPAIALRTGVGLRVPTIQFYEQMRRDWVAFDQAIGRAGAYPRDRARHLRLALSVEKHLAGLAAPDPAWAGFRDDLVACQRAWIEATRTGSERTWAKNRGAYSALVDRAKKMVDEALDDAGVRPSDYRSVRGQLFAGIGFGGFVVAAGTGVGIGSPSGSDPWLVVKLLVACAFLAPLWPAMLIVIGRLSALTSRGV